MILHSNQPGQNTLQAIRRYFHFVLCDENTYHLFQLEAVNVGK